MTRFKPRQEHVGRTQYQLRMPYPAANSMEAFFANFREIERWGNGLPVPRPDTFVPYFFQYAPEDPQETWDVDLVALLQSKFTTDLMPTGTWLVWASLLPTDVPVDAVGIDARVVVNGPNLGIPSAPYESVGYMDGPAVRVVDDYTIDFTAETLDITYKWYLPPVTGYMTANPVSLNLLAINAADDTLTIEGEARYAVLTDDTVDGSLTIETTNSYLYVWAYRISDGYNIPRSLEDVTPA